MTGNERLNNALGKLTADILASYAAEPRTRRIGEMFLPSREKIYEILAEVPLEDNPIHVNALAGAKRCDIMLSGDAVVPSAP